MERGLESPFPSFPLAKIAMAAIIMTPLVDAVIGSLKAAIAEEIKLLWGVEEELENLLSTLSAIRSTLADAEEKQAVSNSVKDWLRKLRDVAYVAEDVVEEFAVEAARAKLEGADATNQRKQVLNFLSCFCSKQILYRHEIGYKIKNVRVRFEKIARERHDFNLKLGDGGKSAELKGRLKTSSLIDESDVLGRTDDKEKLIELLLSDGCNGKPLSVIPIVGMGGLGKTTLARLVYNSRMVRGGFQLLGWVCVSEDFDLVRITKGIVESLTRSKCELTEIDPLANCLKDLLAGKKFLLVLDDVWNENRDYWEELRVPFTYGAPGSKMLVTSRSEKVARIMGTAPAYCLKVLPDKDCWELFTCKALMGETFEAYPYLVETGRKIVNKCQGLPLAIKTLGGILSCKRSQKDWEEIYESPMWNLPEGENSIIPALRLSYHHLPVALKPCFSYCSLFPKDYMFNKDLLVQLWMGEGYIQPYGPREEEGVGNEYFHELLMRSFFQPWERGLYKMHDLIHDLAEHVSEEEFSRVEEGKLPVKSKSVRHLSLILDPHKVERMCLDNFSGNNNLHTFLFNDPLRSFGFVFRSKPFFSESDLDFLLQFKSLRVLCLFNSGIREVPDSIGNLKLLRCLDVSFNHQIEKLPDSLCSLYNLQTLNLESCGKLKELPKRLGELMNLRHLHLKLCQSLTCMPPGIWKLTNLRHLHMEGCYSLTFMKGIGKLTNLRQLRQFIVGTEAGIKITELKNLTNLSGEIRISRLENIVDGEEARQARLKLKQHLDEISFEWSNCLRDGCADMEVLEGLQPHFNLKRLSIWKYAGFRLPSWLHNSLLCNLERLEVYSLAKCQILPPLGQLPSLKYLILERMDSLKKLGQEIRGLGTGRGIQAFPKLKELFLEDLPKLEEWSGLRNGDMPCLDLLRIRMCPMLRHLLYLPPTLTELTIAGCDNLFTELRLSSLQRLELLRSNKILVRSVSHLTSLSSLEIADFDELHSLSDIKLPTSLTSIRISQCDNLEFLPKEMSNLTSLEYLLLRNCPKLANLPEDGLPASLQELCISDCPLLPIEPRLQDLSSLKYIKWEGFNRLQSFSDATLPNTLVSLSISSCENLESLPKDLSTLTYLQHLELYDCPRLLSLPESGLPTSLKHLEINSCLLLKVRCQKDTGEDWHKIAHIVDLEIV